MAKYNWKMKFYKFFWLHSLCARLYLNKGSKLSGRFQQVFQLP